MRSDEKDDSSDLAPDFYAVLLNRLSEARKWLPWEVAELTMYQLAAIMGQRCQRRLQRVTKSLDELNARLKWHQDRIDAGLC